MTVDDSIITSNTQWGIDTYGTVAVGITYSDTWGNTSGNYDDLTKITVGTGCKSVDPLFVNPGTGDFHLQSGSQCRNAASDGGDMGYRYIGPPPPPQPPGQATNPSPATGATNVAINADLSWTAGTGATSHDVYFGTTSPGTFRGNQTGTTFDTGTMANNTTYYWRIDAKNAQGTTTGVVWSFTTTSGGTTVTLYCPAAEDGYMRESTETSNVGGFVSASNALRVGDTNAKLQQIGVISFDTSTIPDGATITSATVSIARTGVTGDPSVLGSLVVDIKNGYYGTLTTPEIIDFEAASSATSVATLPYPTVNNTYVSSTLNSSGLANINKTGRTQFKIRFTTDDDNDTTNDYLSIGDGGTANYKPKLEVTYQ